MGVCLTMIVRNEARVLERCLASCLGVIDAIFVCDTGSTDDTSGVVERFAAAHGLPSSVERHPWVDFGTNRTRACEAAEALIGRLGWDRARSFLLLLDADQIVTVTAPFDAASLVADAYLLPQRSGEEAYWNTRLVRADRVWRYEGATHEYLVVPAGARTDRLAALVVTDLNDGGSRGDKFERDRRLLTTALDRDPTNPRTIFYLARTYRALGDRVRALSLFRRRIECGGWTEEVWHAAFAMAEIYLEAGDLPEARAALRVALRVEPRRAEAHGLLAAVHRTAGRVGAAAAAARRGLRRPFPEGMTLFVDRRPYAHGLRVELARSAATTRHREVGYAALESLLRDRDVPGDAKDRVQAALLDYVERWEPAAYVPLRPTLPAPYVPCNPCVVRDGDGYLVNCRAVNYRQREARYYEILDERRVVRTRNFLMRFGPDLRPLGETELHGEAPPPRVAHIAGFEDVRLLPTSDGLYAVATTVDRHPSGRIGPSLLRLDRSGRVLRDLPLVGYGGERPEKNWVPFLDAGGGPCVHYALDPFVVLGLDLATGEVRPVRVVAPPFDLSRWRNSAGPVPFVTDEGEGHLFVIHEVVFLSDARRRYLHRFVWVAADLGTWRATRPFFFRQLGVEFAAGMCVDATGQHVMVSFGVEDREAWLATIAAASIRARLAALPETRGGDVRSRAVE